MWYMIRDQLVSKVDKLSELLPCFPRFLPLKSPRIIFHKTHRNNRFIIFPSFLKSVQTECRLVFIGNIT